MTNKMNPTEPGTSGEDDIQWKFSQIKGNLDTEELSEGRLVLFCCNTVRNADRSFNNQSLCTNYVF